LEFVWGNPALLSDTDALRFQWPSIGQGWEKGLLAFARSRVASTCYYDGGELQLLHDVADMDNTRVIIVHGTLDPVVPFQRSVDIVERRSQGNKGITFLEMDSVGHDPFEENLDEFLKVIMPHIGVERLC
jgi:pimeloyl-ACP methyl ester carboxylesterase